MSDDNKHKVDGPNVAAVLEKKGEMVIKEVPMPKALGPNDVRVMMKSVGICGSDVHYWTHGAIGDFVVKAPMIMGHESSGVVVAVGEEVKHLKAGDRVALEPGVPCRKCERCKTGEYNLCPDMQFFATPPVHGSMAKYINHPADFCFKLPENVSNEEGALCEPLSVGVYSCRRANIGPGSKVLITGCGPIGIICMWVAKAFGASAVYMTDVSEERMAFAKKHGATAVLSAKVKPDELAAAVMKLNGQHVDSSIECCGFESATTTCILATKSGGTVCLVGLAQPEMKLPIFQASTREVDIKGIFRYRNTYPTCIELLAHGKVDVKPLITHRYPMKDLLTAFEIARTGKDGAMKVMFSLNDA